MIPEHLPERMAQLRRPCHPLGPRLCPLPIPCLSQAPFERTPDVLKLGAHHPHPPHLLPPHHQWLAPLRQRQVVPKVRPAHRIGFPTSEQLLLRKVPDRRQQAEPGLPLRVHPLRHQTPVDQHLKPPHHILHHVHGHRLRRLDREPPRKDR